MSTGGVGRSAQRALLAFVIAGLLAGCGDDSRSTRVAEASAVEPTGVVVPVYALDNSFRPELTTVEVGDEVRWENRGRNDHDILYVEGVDFGISTDNFGPGAVYSHVFDRPGEYRYYCTIHGDQHVGMTGTIIVTE